MNPKDIVVPEALEHVRELLSVDIEKMADINIIEAIKIVREVLGVDLGEAKRLVSQSPRWRGVHEVNKALHRDAIRALVTWDCIHGVENGCEIVCENCGHTCHRHVPDGLPGCVADGAGDGDLCGCEDFEGTPG